MAKNAMSNLRIDAIRHLNDIGMMTNPLKEELEADVLPWLIAKMQGFMSDDFGLNIVTEQLINEGIHKQRIEHGVTLQNKIDDDRRAELEKIRAKKADEQRKKDRRAAREKRAKDQAKAAMK